MNIATLRDLLRYRDLNDLDLTRHELDRLVKAGAYERIAPGVFLRAG
ncbi:type IV toxin-antitoxin system AbiEi family antitoxin domain-containing protein [Microlunatus elymi]|nr:type IV toxin-antitoxin system AbiEi family antitoxin domain-containing protein [Microlunatus elymi]